MNGTNNSEDQIKNTTVTDAILSFAIILGGGTLIAKSAPKLLKNVQLGAQAARDGLGKKLKMLRVRK